MSSACAELVTFFCLVGKADVAFYNSVARASLRAAQQKEQLLLSPCAGLAEPWAEAAGLPSALPVLKLLSIQLF